MTAIKVPHLVMDNEEVELNLSIQVLIEWVEGIYLNIAKIMSMLYNRT